MTAMTITLCIILLAVMICIAKKVTKAKKEKKSLILAIIYNNLKKAEMFTDEMTKEMFYETAKNTKEYKKSTYKDFSRYTEILEGKRETKNNEETEKIEKMKKELREQFLETLYKAIYIGVLYETLKRKEELEEGVDEMTFLRNLKKEKHKIAEDMPENIYKTALIIIRERKDIYLKTIRKAEEDCERIFG